MLQYVPAWNNIDAWQLYSGSGYTAPAVVPAGRWIHVKIEVAGTQARVYLDGAPQPALVVPELRHGRRAGGVGLMGPADGSAFVSNFAFRADSTLGRGSSPHRPVQPGFVRHWQLSRVYPALAIDPDDELAVRVASATWTAVEADEYGLVDIGRHRARRTGPEVIYAKTTIHAGRDEVWALRVGRGDARLEDRQGVRCA